MKRIIAFALLAFVPFAVFAAKTLKVSESIEIAAPPEKVWDKLNDFNGWNKWHPAVAKSEIVDKENNKKGAVRVLTLQDGGKIKETLLGYDAKAKNYRYNIVESPLPVQDYESSIKVKPGKSGGSLVEWSGKFKSKGDDKAATDTITGIYKSGLENLKKVVEGK